MIHLVHDLTDSTVLLFGGGRVGARRARAFDEATVIVVSPSFVDADYAGASLVRAAPEPDDVRAWIARTEPALVVAATDDHAVNDAVAAATHEAGVLLNRVDRSTTSVGAVDVPATIRDGTVVASVSTGGRSPGLSGFLRDRIADAIDGSGAMAELTGELRRELLDSDVSIERRREALRAVVRDERVWRAVREGDDATPVVDEITRDALGEPAPDRGDGQ